MFNVMSFTILSQMTHLDKQFRFILLIMVASHSLASVRNMLIRDWHELRLSLKKKV